MKCREETWDDTVTTPEGKLAGILTDGDLRRLMEKHGGATLAMTAGDCMVRTPQTIGPKILASEALNLMEKKKITSIVVVDPPRKRWSGCPPPRPLDARTHVVPE